jgi:hypothetical protein
MSEQYPLHPLHLTSLPLCLRCGLPKVVADCCIVASLKEFKGRIRNYTFIVLKIRFTVYGNSQIISWIYEYVDLKLKPIFFMAQQPLVGQSPLIID